MAEIQIIGVVGGGQMGSGIALLAAAHGIEVWLHDSDLNALSRAHNYISDFIQNIVPKGNRSQVLSLSLSLSVYFLDTAEQSEL